MDQRPLKSESHTISVAEDGTILHYVDGRPIRNPGENREQYRKRMKVQRRARKRS